MFRKTNIALPYRSLILLLMGVCLSFTFKSTLEDNPEVYYVFQDSWIHGAPSGFMGERDGKSIKLNDTCTENPYAGTRCIKLAVDNSEGWRGLHIQYAGVWNANVNETTKLADLSAYDKLEFYARADVKDGDPYVLPEVGVGDGSTNEEKVNDTYLEIGKEWKRYVIPINNIERHRYNTLMFLLLPTGTLYLDEIKFIKKKTK